MVSHSTCRKKHLAQNFLFPSEKQKWNDRVGQADIKGNCLRFFNVFIIEIILSQSNWSDFMKVNLPAL